MAVRKEIIGHGGTTCIPTPRQKPGERRSGTPAPALHQAAEREAEHPVNIAARSRRDGAYLHREFKRLITKAIFFFYYYFLQTKLINQITQDAHYAKLN